ncbi:Uncharacterized membrane protein YesL [Gracilibacillus orientalis]|uniref:Uncharacterized membrane protein YesL n=1 Tax=Gracilibacillus orientalis TaxID=334253 RepID=A0A1I4IGU9_9BACI|nr:DUF624 domain-containing protein [Gracilibacillus orientalis]SFL53287.1 Uncharacterized membrane protein YesL [Gracilibacillus orientalis]
MQFDTSGGLFKICEWLYRLALLNMLAIGFTLLGGIVLGFFPAITAMFSLNNKWLKTEEFPIMKEFWKAYKQQFVKSNLLGGLIVVTATALYIDFVLVQNFNGILYYLILSSSATVLVLSFIVLLYVFSLMIEFPDNGLMKQIKRAIQVSTLFPLQTIWMGLSLVSFLFICWVIPGFAFLFLGSGLTFIAMYFSQFALKRLDKYKTLPSNVRIIEERGALHGE